MIVLYISIILFLFVYCLKFLSLLASFLYRTAVFLIYISFNIIFIKF